MRISRDPGSALIVPLSVRCLDCHSGANVRAALHLGALRHAGTLLLAHHGDIGGRNRSTEKGDTQDAGHDQHNDGPTAERLCGFVESTISIVSFSIVDLRPL